MIAIKKITLLFTALLFFSVVSSVYAQHQVPAQIQSPQDVVAQRCALLTTNIDTRINKYTTNKQTHVENFTNVKNKLDTMILTFSNSGYDVTKLRADSKMLEDKIKKLGTDYDLYIAKLGETKSYACGTSQGMFVTTLNVAKNQLLIVSQDMYDIKNYYQRVIRVDMTMMKNQQPKN